jgi:DNA-binding MarR family transcriptional regulator
MTRKPSPKQLDATYAFFNEIGIIAQLSSNRQQRVLPNGLTGSQFSVLTWFVRVADEATPGRLATAFQVTKGAMTNTLTKLKDKGFLAIEPDPESGRRKIVRLTPAGRRARDDAVTSTHPRLAEFLQHVDARQIEAVLPFLQAVRKYLDESR